MEPTEPDPMAQRVHGLMVEILELILECRDDNGQSVTDLITWMGTMEEREHPGITVSVLHSVIYSAAGILAAASEATGRDRRELLAEILRELPTTLLHGPDRE